MMDKETFKKELVRMWDSSRDKYKEAIVCADAKCYCCALYQLCSRDGCNKFEAFNAFEVVAAIEEWSKEHPPKKYKVSQLEYDILKVFIECGFDNFHWLDKDKLLMSLLEKGYFKGATKDMSIKDYFDNCEVKKQC